MIDPDIKEVADEVSLPEAPASVTFRVYYKGCSILATSRDVNTPLAPLVEKAMKGIDWALDNGCKPSWNEETNGKVNGTATPPKVEKTKKCDHCGGTRTLKVGVSKAGKRWAGWLCDNRESDCPPEWVNLNSTK